MKLQYKTQSHKLTRDFISAYIVIIVITICMNLFSDINFSKEDIYKLILELTVLLTIPILIAYIYETKKYKNIQPQSDWKKQRGYIISCYSFNILQNAKYIFHGKTEMERKTKYYLKVLSNDKIYIIKGLDHNEAYEKLKQQISNIKDYGNGNFILNKIPIDMYIKDDKYYADLESVEIS